MSSFRKLNRNTNELFKKAKSDTNNFFKKTGNAIDKNIKGDLASGLGSASKIIRQGVNQGGKILNAVEKSPFGAALAPITTMARTGLNNVGVVGSIAGQSKGLIRDAYKGKPGEAIGNMLERAKQIENTGRKIQYS